MKIHLPNSAFLGNIDPFLRSFDPSEPDRLEITANEKWISIHPVVISMVAALGLRVKPENIHFAKLEAKSKHYLERIGLFKTIGVDSNIKILEHEPAGRFIPLTMVKNQTEASRVIVDLVPLLHLRPKQAEPIRYIVSELVRNVLEHARSPYGAILCAQFYKKTNIIRIGIVDTGIGITNSINISHHARDDLDAIRLALTPGITGTTARIGGTDSNAGAGLFFIKSIACTSRNFFILYSGNAMFKLLTRPVAAKRRILNSDPLKDRHSATTGLPRWQGTVVGIDISLGQKPEFTELLDMIRTTFCKVISEQKKMKFKRARFI